MFTSFANKSILRGNLFAKIADAFWFMGNGDYDEQFGKHAVVYMVSMFWLLSLGQFAVNIFRHGQCIMYSIFFKPFSLSRSRRKTMCSDQ